MFDGGFVLKKLITAFCMPLPLLCLLIFFSIFLFLIGKKKLARVLLGFAAVFFYLISIQPSANFLISHLENQYPSYQKKQHELLDYVLVLGSAHVSDSSQPITSLLIPSGLLRLSEGVRVYKLNPGSKLLLSGYSAQDEITHAEALKKVALHFGVPEQDMILDGKVKDTKEESMHWVTVAKNKRMALVTSASHMPRSMYLFDVAQLEAGYRVDIIPAPTDYISHQNSKFSWKDWFPSGRNIETVERAWHEYLGLMWAYLRS